MLFRSVRAVNVDGIAHVSVAFEVRSIEEFWRRLADEIERDRTTVPLVAASLSHTMPANIERVAKLVGRRELAQMTHSTKAIITDKKLKHTNDTQLTDHVCRAVGFETGAGYTLSASKSPGPIELARAMVWAVGFASKPARQQSRPVMAFAKRS